MKGTLMIIGIILLVIIVLTSIIIVYILLKPAVPKDYYNKVDTTGDIESKYTQMGTHNVKNVKIDVMENFKSYRIWYPEEMKTSNKKYPVVIFANGTGVKAAKYPALFEHLASWGFIAIGTDEKYSWNGFSSEMSLRLMVKLNSMKNIPNLDGNPFYGKVDLDNIGVSGHSQGGVGAINSATNTNHASMYKAIYSASMTNKDLASNLEWDFDAREISIPTLLVSGTGEIDNNKILSLEQMKSIYDDIPNTTMKLMIRRVNADHEDMLYYGDGYMTAWFIWLLQGDEEAAKAFKGSSSEILNNKNWQDGINNIE